MTFVAPPSRFSRCLTSLNRSSALENCPAHLARTLDLPAHISFRKGFTLRPLFLALGMGLESRALPVKIRVPKTAPYLRRGSGEPARAWSPA